MLRRLPYPLLCALLGIALAWIPAFLHGPIAHKFNVLYIQGSIAVWAFYGSRLLVGFWVGVGTWPGPWFVRGPLYGFFSLLPVSLVSLATPGCGFT